MGIGKKYFILQQTDPEYIKPNEPSKIMFSIQDYQGRDVNDMIVSVEIYSSTTGERLAVFPWKFLNIGDFEVAHTFTENGNYQVVLSILNDDMKSEQSQIINTVPLERVILNDNMNCDCERAVFNISVTESFGIIFGGVVYASVLGVVAIVGAVLIWMYLSRRKDQSTSVSNDEFIKYCVLFLAVGASIVHFAVTPGHAGLKIAYSIFLISAAGGQLLYGIMYLFLIYSDDKLALKKSDKNYVSKEYYKKSLIYNWCGLTGSLVLIFLYTYTLFFPPPLSPNPYPEDLSIGGIIAKALEIILVVGIIYLMKSEKKRYMNSIHKTSDSNNT
ncbi:MAG: hypothetical protein AB7U98_14805 [Candidatus Nitrosocosmicus sp.]